MSILNRFMKDESGATAIEYAMLAAVMGGFIWTGVTMFRPYLMNAFWKISSMLNAGAGAY